MDMKQNNTVALCAIGRMENQYAQEFAEHYLQLGFSHLYLYDNARPGEERLDSALSGLVANGSVTIIPWPDTTEDAQRTAYNDCYHRYGPKHAWIAFFDFDEFLTITSGERIDTFMQRYQDFDCLLVNWMDMTDNNLLESDGRPLMERFTQPMPLDRHVGGNYPENNHVKSIVRTGISGLAFRNPHVPKEPRLLCCNTRGQKCKQAPRQPYDHSTAYLKHFTTKTIGEWLHTKLMRGVPDRTDERFRRDYADFFFRINERTPEKEAYIARWQNRRGRVAAGALGRMGNQMFIAAAAMTFARRTGREFIGLVYNHGPKYDYDYPEQQFQTVMRHVPYIEPSEVSGFYHMTQGPYISNGFPDVSEPDVVLCDYYQDATCIDRDIALQLFAPYDSILQEIADEYGDLSDVVCVNVRRGDYLNVQRHGFRVLTKEEILDMLREHFPSVFRPLQGDSIAAPRRVLFVSDDIPWCRQQFAPTAALRSLQGDSIAVIFADRPCRYKPETDLYLMTQCGAGCIIANSTFSWWGAYLNPRAEKVVCPWPWFTDQKHPKMTNLLPPSWIKHGNDWLLYVTYHKPELIQEYHLDRLDSHYQLFDARQDPMNTCMSEFVTLRHVWANRVRSAYVGFCHYRRLLTVTSLPNSGECQVRKRIRFPNGETMYQQYARCHNIKDLDLLLSITDRRYGPDNPYSRYLRTSTTMLPNVCFLMAWRDYMKMGDFLFPLLDDFAAATGCGTDLDKWHQKAVADFGEADAPYQQRLPGFLAERLVSAWISINLKWYI